MYRHDFSNPDGLDQVRAVHDGARHGTARPRVHAGAGASRNRAYAALSARLGPWRSAQRQRAAGALPGAIGVKTGYTELAGQTIVAAAERGGAYADRRRCWRATTATRTRWRSFDWAFTSTRAGLRPIRSAPLRRRSARRRGPSRKHGADDGAFDGARGERLDREVAAPVGFDVARRQREDRIAVAERVRRDGSRARCRPARRWRVDSPAASSARRSSRRRRSSCSRRGSALRRVRRASARACRGSLPGSSARGPATTRPRSVSSTSPPQLTATIAPTSSPPGPVRTPCRRRPSASAPRRPLSRRCSRCRHRRCLARPHRPSRRARPDSRRPRRDASCCCRCRGRRRRLPRRAGCSALPNLKPTPCSSR